MLYGYSTLHQCPAKTPDLAAHMNEWARQGWSLIGVNSVAGAPAGPTIHHFFWSRADARKEPLCA